MLPLILGGAAVHRCDNRFVFESGFSRRGCHSGPELDFFRRLFKPAASALISSQIAENYVSYRGIALAMP
jgi:hypothetical protein